jgi:hypothetical protein
MPGERPRCAKPMKFHEISRPRDYDPAPACGRPAGHPGRCITAESYQRYLQKHKDYQAALRNKTP